MQIPEEFETIRAYQDNELNTYLPILLNDDNFREILKNLIPEIPFEQLKENLEKCETILDLQKTFVGPLVRKVVNKISQNIDLKVYDKLNKSTPYTFISNHRDIVLDAALLCVLMLENGFSTTVEIAIGDNLLAYPWIKHLVRLNKAFIVQRSLSVRETWQASKTLSRYMHWVITEKHNPIWIAQREGRAKDSNDKTQDSVLKMLAMGVDLPLVENLKELNIVPLTISYEYDPCDYLKAKEFQLKRDNPNHKKTKADDLENMNTGIFGYKGKIHYQMANCINDWLDTLNGVAKADFFAQVASHLDEEIYKGYRLFPNNYIAADQLSEKRIYTAHYTSLDMEKFQGYLAKQLSRITIPNRDDSFLVKKMLEMYANPVFNKERAIRQR